MQYCAQYYAQCIIIIRRYLNNESNFRIEFSPNMYDKKSITTISRVEAKK